ncbi:MAG: alanine--glyoxylate aminotransferase family protein [Candidatus Margulisbacteria bacterium]|nr:alanine--glyoxylate aminotransferase family protein [Candidatus Margulisiibacteriota bacterium]MBU1021076.1 alanine--glyoxylate aminotransferase family protein [Candidatus Margulisiibacteriota bacterium]MBU1729885.1 alanine--glyoxylate aminotransferase family protein [Candidatus Margulisiibacteriota bacterium]MBU1955215.1 alanine--glyoxylate aminotransferase family protein [Candidatus Margulisiibacteriota bacterium]
MSKKKLLMVLGPTEIEENIRQLGALPQVYNRTPEFSSLMKRINKNLQYLFKTKNPVFTLSCSGTGAMEAAVTNTLSPGDKVLIINGGTFGERWVKICKKHKLKVKEIKLRYGKAINPTIIENLIKKDKQIKAVFTTHNETSTGVLTDIKTIGKIVHKTKAILIVDAISSIGVEPLEMDQWHCDVVITSSQKALALPPGLAFISFSPKVWKYVKKARLRTFYFDAFDYLKNWKRGQTPFTPSISLIFQLDVRLQKVKKIGLQQIQNKYKLQTNMLRSGIKALGLKLAGERPANCVTGVWAPKKIDASKIVKIMSKKHGISIAPSPGILKTRLFRIGNFGDIDQKDIIRTISSLEKILTQLGCSVIPQKSAVTKALIKKRY